MIKAGRISERKRATTTKQQQTIRESENLTRLSHLGRGGGNYTKGTTIS